MANTNLQLALTNQTTSSTVYAYVTGQAIQENNALLLLNSSGGLYYPTNPSAIGSPLAENCAIPLGAPGSTKTVNVPQIAGGRIWFSINNPLTFLLNPGPALVEPSVTNDSDPNINVQWDFCEFTFNSSQLFANISYVDFVSIPIALSLTSSSGPVQTVTGIPANGLTTVCNGLVAQTAADGRPWSSLIVKDDAGVNLRVLSPNNAGVQGANFDGYYEPFVSQCFQRFDFTSLSVNTQGGYGTVTGRASGNALAFSNQQFTTPSTADIFSCSTGPFATGSDQERNAIIPRLAAGFNRSTLLTVTAIPAPAADYYQQSITNHYARIVHAANVDGIGYAFPYDDVTPDGGPDQSGKVESGNPTLFTITVGGCQYPGAAGTIPAETYTSTITGRPTGTGAAKAAGVVNTANGAVQEPSNGPATAQPGQKPMGAPKTQCEEGARKLAEAASKGPTATPTKYAIPAPGPGTAPHPKKPGFWKRMFAKLRAKLRRKKRGNF